MSDLSLVSELLAWMAAGFLGGIHCLGMCGGLAAALGLNIAHGRRFPLLLAANCGRLFGYVLIGALLGGLAATLAWLPQAVYLQRALYLLSLLLIMVLGLYLAGWSAWLLRIEHIGKPLWRWLQPRFAGLLPLRSFGGALLAGAIWGWLPCGLVYTAAMAALASGSARSGSLLMLAFGLGTLPNLLAMGMAASQLQQLRSRQMVRRIAGGLLLAYGAWRLCIYLFF